MKQISTLLLITFITLSLLISSNLFAGNTPIKGSWFLEKVFVKGQPHEMNTDFTFKDDGYVEMRGDVFGTWSYDEKSKMLTIDSKMIKEFSGTRKVVTLNDKELVFSDKETKFMLIKMDREAIHKANLGSGLVGLWKVEAKEGSYGTNYITFKDDDTYKIKFIDEGMTSSSGGDWSYSSEKKELTLNGRPDIFRGKSSIISIAKEKIEAKNNGEILTLVKLKQASKKIERISFKVEDFWGEDGSPKYDIGMERGKLPWSNPMDFYKLLKDKKTLKYNYSVLNNELNIFDSKTLIAKIKTKESGKFINLDDIFNGFDSETVPEGAEFPQNGTYGEDYISPFYPRQEIEDFRVLEIVEVTTPAGTFKCTPVEGLINGDEFYFKYYMINDKPGVYAKVIIEKDMSFDEKEYSIYELTEIK